MEFMADMMLGKLAKWLRVLGHDTIYFVSIEDREFLEMWRGSGRVLLTRDRRLMEKAEPDGRAVFIENDNPWNQLKEIMAKLNIPMEMEKVLTICIGCNSRLAVISKDEVKERVPPYVYRTVDSYTACSTCGKVFWNGTHRRSMLERLGELGREAG
jgi:uncharacterized protein with PIN domain